METVALTHVGNVRETNEDSYLLHTDEKPYYFMIADGMGGHAAGEIASSTACAAIAEYIDGLNTEVLTKDQVKKAFEYANEKILEQTKNDPNLEGMGTTLTFIYVCGDDIMIAHVGDSRAYRKSGSSIRKITKDHTYVQLLIDNGILKKKAADRYPFKSFITRAVGMDNITVDFYADFWEDGDILLLCSDGLTNYADEKKLYNILSEKKELHEKAQHLVDFALASGGKDNISLILAQKTADEEETE